MADLHIYRRTLEPILLPGETANLLMAKGLVRAKVLAVTALPEYIKDFGALSAASTTTGQSDSNLQLNTLELAQLRMRVLDDFRVKLYNPAPTKLWVTAKTDFWLPKFPDDPDFLREFFWQASEFFVWEDDYPNFDLVAVGAVAKSRIAFSGWKYKIVEIKEPGKVSIWIGSWPSAAV